MKQKENCKVVVLLIALFTISPVTLALGKTIYVDDGAAASLAAPYDGAINGTSWQSAYIYLQDALADANKSEKPVEIRVAHGTYTPDKGANQSLGNSDATFQLINGVTLAGGYAGLNVQDSNTDPNTRDIELYETILSGDLNGDDLENSNPYSMLNDLYRNDNCSNVVTGDNTDATAIIDGFTITKGNLIEISFSGYTGGAGMYIYSGSPTISNCNFNYNAAIQIGGAICIISDSNPTLTNCTFTQNFAGLLGAAMYIGSSSTSLNDGGNPILNNCIFTGNTSSGNGVIYTQKGNPILANCTLSDNSALDITVFEESNSIITNCILWNGGSEIWSDENSDIVVNYSNIQGGWVGLGNIDEDPLFADPDNGDYHLKSEYGRWNPNTQTWVTDDVTSPCIDTGDPESSIGNEPESNGGIINMGAYGGTDQASKSQSQSEIPSTVNVTDSDNGSLVALVKGQILAVTLESNPTTGYSWEVVESQSSFLEQYGDSYYIPSDQDEGTVGAGGWEIFRFKAKNAGQGNLELAYRQSWDSNSSPAKTFTIYVIVN